jgi:hypothetical protein
VIGDAGFDALAPHAAADRYVKELALIQKAASSAS